jgi:hypothetical protein
MMYVAYIIRASEVGSAAGAKLCAIGQGQVCAIGAAPPDAACEW